MERRPRAAVGVHPQVRKRRRPKSNNYLWQFLLLLSVSALLLGSLVAWKVYGNERGWREWSMSMRSGMFGMHGNRSGGKSNEDLGEELAGKSIRYRGGGQADLGEFSIGRYNAITNTTLTVSFLLRGMTPYESEASFHEFMQENERAFRDRVTEAVRDCREQDYTDTNSMSKKVVARVNRAFNGRLLQSAELADFEVFESVGNYQTENWQTGRQAAGEEEK